MKRTYHHIKLRVKTVQDLKRLIFLTTEGSLDDVIVSMSLIANDHYAKLKSSGWGPALVGFWNDMNVFYGRPLGIVFLNSRFEKPQEKSIIGG